MFIFNNFPYITPHLPIYHPSHHRDNVTVPHVRPNLRSRLHFRHSQEGNHESSYEHVVALEKKNFPYITGGKPYSCQVHDFSLPHRSIYCNYPSSQVLSGTVPCVEFTDLSIQICKKCSCCQPLPIIVANNSASDLP